MSHSQAVYVNTIGTAIRYCRRCGIAHDWTRSTSTLKMTYCSVLCERGDLGFTIEALERIERWPNFTVLPEYVLVA